MVTVKSLVMKFKNQLGKDQSIRIDEPREDITEVEVLATMNTLIEKDIFELRLVEPVSAQVVTRTVEEYDID